MENNLVFVYAKDNEIKVLDFEKAKNIEDVLKSEGWFHTATLDPCVFIQHLHNNCEEFELSHEIKLLSKIPKLK